jgi:hypothetical protein
MSKKFRVKIYYGWNLGDLQYETQQNKYSIANSS